MTKQEFKQQLKELVEKMMIENTGFKSYDDWANKSGDFYDCQTEDEENKWEATEKQVSNTSDFIESTLQQLLNNF